MKFNYSRLIIRSTGIFGLTAASILIGLSSLAQTPGPSTPSIPRTTPSPRTAPSPPPRQRAETKNLIQVLESNGSFTILTKLLKDAALVETLQGSDSFTIFAPTDEAFKRLPQGLLGDLSKPENKEVLVKLLTYHVVRGKLLFLSLNGRPLTSLQGDLINVTVNGHDSRTVNDLNISQPDLDASNGVIHVIDGVMFPPSWN